MQFSNGSSQTSTDARVLIAEDNADQREQYRLSLKLVGICADFAPTSAAALEAVNKRLVSGGAYDLIVSDLLFKGEQMQGSNLVKAIRDAGVQWPIVFCTSRHDEKVEIPVALLNVADVWYKPEDLPDFAENVMSYLKPAEGLPVKSEKAKANAQQRAVDQKTLPPLMTVLLVLVTVSVAANCFMLYRSIYTVGAMRDIQRYVTAKSGTVVEPGGYRVFVPTPKSAFQKMKDGSSRVTFQFEAKDAAAAESLAGERGVPFYVNITRTRGGK